MRERIPFLSLVAPFLFASPRLIRDAFMLLMHFSRRAGGGAFLKWRPKVGWAPMFRRSVLRIFYAPMPPMARRRLTKFWDLRLEISARAPLHASQAPSVTGRQVFLFGKSR